MKSLSSLLVALGLVSSAVLAQSDRPLPASDADRMPDAEAVQPAAGQGLMPPPTMGGESGAATPAAEDGTLSSGASSAEAPSGSGGQLITPAIVQSRPATQTSALSIKPQTENGVTYMCGGIGEDESTYMRQTAARDYDLMMTFAEKNGNYVADVAVSIKDARGKTILETTCDGPILLVDFPKDGSYRIHAEAAGQALDRTVLVKGGKAQARQLTFAWPASAGGAAARK